MKQHLDINIYGKVQGVFFRAQAMEKAMKLNITGYADRLQGGNIQIEAEGEEKDLRNFLQWCQRGPYLAKVEMIIVEYSSEIKNFSFFEIRKSQIEENSLRRVRFMATR